MKTVLVIDDEVDILNLLARFLKTLGFDAITADNIETARNHISECDVILSDIRIGSGNGIDFLRELRNQGVNKPFLLMSSDRIESETEAAIEITGHPVLFKPDILKELPSIVQDLNFADGRTDILPE